MTMPAFHHSVSTGRMPFLLPNQQRQNTEGNCIANTLRNVSFTVTFERLHMLHENLHVCVLFSTSAISMCINDTNIFFIVGCCSAAGCSSTCFMQASAVDVL